MASIMKVPRISLERLKDELPKEMGDSIPMIASGLVDDNHYVTVLMDQSGHVWSVLNETDIRNNSDTVQLRKTLPRLEVKDMSVFNWYLDEAMESLKKIGNPDHLIEFTMYETTGGVVGCEKSLHRIEF